MCGQHAAEFLAGGWLKIVLGSVRSHSFLWPPRPGMVQAHALSSPLPCWLYPVSRLCAAARRKWCERARYAWSLEGPRVVTRCVLKLSRFADRFATTTGCLAAVGAQEVCQASLG